MIIITNTNHNINHSRFVFGLKVIRGDCESKHLSMSLFLYLYSYEHFLSDIFVVVSVMNLHNRCVDNDQKPTVNNVISYVYAFPASNICDILVFAFFISTSPFSNFSFNINLSFCALAFAARLFCAVLSIKLPKCSLVDST